MKINIDNRYAALSSTEEDADLESQEYGSAGHGVGIIGVGGQLALLKKCDNLAEGLRRIILLEQDSGINYSPSDAPAGFSAKLQHERQYADADAVGSDGLEKKLPPRLGDFTFSFPSPLTERTKATRGVATTRTRTIAAAQKAAASLLEPPTTSHNVRCIVGDGNKAVVLSPPSSSASFTSHSPLVLSHGEESAEQKFFFWSLAEEEDIDRLYLLNKANSLGQTSSASSRAMLSNRPATVPSPPAQTAPLRSCIPLSPKLIPVLAKGRVPTTPRRPCCKQPPLPKFIPPTTARKLATQGRDIPVCLLPSSIETPASPLVSIDDPARMEKTREKRKGEGKESWYDGLSSSAERNNDTGVVERRREESWLKQELLRMWKESGDDSSSSTVTTPTASIGSERRRPELTKMSSVFSTMTGGEDDAKVVDAGWLEYIMIPPPIDYENGQGAVGKGNEKFEVPVITSVVAPAGFEDEDKGTKRVSGSDVFADGERKEEGEEEEGLLVELLDEREMEIGIENIAGGREGGGLADDLDLASEMEMGESWGWDVINRVEAYD